MSDVTKSVAGTQAHLPRATHTRSASRPQRALPPAPAQKCGITGNRKFTGRWAGGV